MGAAIWVPLLLVGLLLVIVAAAWADEWCERRREDRP